MVWRWSIDWCDTLNPLLGNRPCLQTSSQNQEPRPDPFLPDHRAPFMCGERGSWSSYVKGPNETVPFVPGCEDPPRMDETITGQLDRTAQEEENKWRSWLRWEIWPGLARSMEYKQANKFLKFCWFGLYSMSASILSRGGSAKTPFAHVNIQCPRIEWRIFIIFFAFRFSRFFLNRFSNLASALSTPLDRCP